jgi:hypothetical protein
MVIFQAIQIWLWECLSYSGWTLLRNFYYPYREILPSFGVAGIYPCLLGFGLLYIPLGGSRFQMKQVLCLSFCSEWFWHDVIGPILLGDLSMPVFLAAFIVE